MDTASLHNEEIRLRAPEPADLNFLYQLENDESLWPLGNVTLPFSRYTLKKYIEENAHDIFIDHQARFIIERMEDEKITGAIDLANFDPLHLRAEVGIVILPQWRRHHYARQAIELLSNYCRHFLHFHQLYAYIPENNKSSLQLSAQCGFISSGILKEWLLAEDKFHDVHLVQKIF